MTTPRSRGVFTPPRLAALLRCAGLLAFFLLFPSIADAATLYWVGTDGANTSVATNWKTTDPSACGGGDAGAAPSTSDTAIFDADCDNGATVNSALSVTAATLQSGYTGTTTLSAALTTSGTLTISGGTLSQGSLTITAGALTVSGGTLTGGSGTLDVNGTITLSSGTLTATSGTFTVSGDWTKTGGTFTPGTNRVTFDGTGVQTLTSGGTSFYALTSATNGSLGGQILLADTLTVTNNVTINTDAFINIGGSNWTMTGATFSNNGTLLRAGGETITGLTQDTDSGSWQYACTGTCTVTDFGDTDYYKLEIANSGASDIAQLGAALNVRGTLLLTTGILDVSSSSYGITVGGGWTDTGAGAFTERSGTVTFDGTGTINSNDNFYNLTVNGSGITVTLGATLDVDNTLTLTAGTLDVSSTSYGITVAGGWTDTGAGTFTEQSGTVTFDGSSGTQTLNANEAFNNVTHSGASTLQLSTNNLTVGGTFTNSAGTFDANALTNTVTGLATISGGTYTASTATQTFNGGLTISGGTLTGSSGTVDVNGTVTLSSGTLTAPSGTFTVSGDWTKTGGTFTSGSNTVTFDGTSGQTLTTGGTDTGSDFNNFTVNKSSGTLSLATNALDVDDTLTVSSGTFSPGSLAVTTATLTVSGGTFTGGAGTVDVNGAVTVSSGTLTAPSGSGSFTISGNFTHSGGTFTHNSGTVTLDGTDQTLSGATTFNGLTKTVTTARTLTFPASSTQTIAGTLTLKGASGALLSLRSSSAGTQWNINPQGSRSIEYLDVKDSNNTNTTNISCTTGCTNSGNNTSWVFLLSTSTPTLDSPADDALLNTVKPTFIFKRVTDSALDSYALLLDAGKSNAKTVTLGNPADNSADARAQVTVRRSGSDISVEVTDTDLLTEGSHTWKIRAADSSAGTADSSTRSLTIDITKPTVRAVTITPATTAGGDDLGTSPLGPAVLGVDVTDNHELKEIKMSLARHRALLGERIETITVQETTRSARGTKDLVQFSLGTLAEGRYTLTVTVRDKAGNERVETKTLGAHSTQQAAPTLRETIEKVTEALERGEQPPSRSPVEFHLETLEKEAKLRRAKEAENLQTFLRTLLGEERLEGLDRTIAAWNASFRSGLRSVAVATKDRFLATLGFTRTQLASFGGFLAVTREETSVVVAGISERLRARAPEGVAIALRAQEQEQKTTLARLRAERAARLDRIEGVVPQIAAGTVLAAQRTRERATALVLTARKNRLELALNTAQPLDRAIVPLTRLAGRVGLGTRLALEVVRGRHEEPLRISDVGITALTPTSATVSWETNRVASGQVNWGETPSYGAVQGTEGGRLSTDDSTTTHRITLENLTPSKKYYFEVLATDLAGQQTFDAYYSFSTPLEARPLTGSTPGE